MPAFKTITACHSSPYKEPTIPSLIPPTFPFDSCPQAASIPRRSTAVPSPSSPFSGEPRRPRFLPLLPVSSPCPSASIYAHAPLFLCRKTTEASSPEHAGVRPHLRVDPPLRSTPVGDVAFLASAATRCPRSSPPRAQEPQGNRFPQPTVRQRRNRAIFPVRSPSNFFLYKYIATCIMSPNESVPGG